jgi:regulatory protein
VADRPARRETFAERKARRGAIEDPAVVLEAAARFLEARSRSEAEVRRRLTTAGYRADLVDAAIVRLIELRMLDDEAFARAWVESRDRAQPRGERAIREELRLKGVGREIVARVLEERRQAALEVTDDDAQGAVSADRGAAERLLTRNARSLERVTDPRQRRQRAYALLARHGFDPETCRETAARMVAAAEEDPESGG